MSTNKSPFRRQVNANIHHSDAGQSITPQVAAVAYDIAPKPATSNPQLNGGQNTTREMADRIQNAMQNYSNGYYQEPFQGAVPRDEQAKQEELESEEVDEDEIDDDNDDEEEFIDGYGRKSRLPESVFVRRNISQLMTLLDGDYLDINPSYQRGVVWPKVRMSKLIDSLFENFYVPPVLFNVELIKTADGTSRFRRTCVDGKQRLTSIQDFMHGKIGCHDRKGASWFYCIETDDMGRPVKKANRKLLPESLKEEFRNKDLLCCEYIDLTESQEREIFQRVQLGMALTGAEAFKATTGKWQTYAQQYEKDFPGVINLCVNRRAQGFRRTLICFAQIYECQDPSNADGVPRLKSSIKSITQLCQSEDSLNVRTKNHLRFVFETFNTILRDFPEVFESNAFTRVKTFSPVELVAISVLLSQYGDKRSIGMLKGDITYLRNHLRQLFTDLQMNERCWKPAWEFIQDLERYRGTVDGSTSLKRSTRNDGPVLDSRQKPGKARSRVGQVDLSDISTRGPGSIAPGQRQDDLVILNHPAKFRPSQMNNHRGNGTPSQNRSRGFNDGQHTAEAVQLAKMKRAHLNLESERGGHNALVAKKARLMGIPNVS